MGEERRGEDRYPAETFANIEFLVEGRVRQIGHVARTLDISLSGARIEANLDGPMPMGPGGEVFLTLAMIDVLMKVRGRIAHTRETSEIDTEIGIQFLNIQAEELGLISAFLTAWKKREGIEN